MKINNWFTFTQFLYCLLIPNINYIYLTPFLNYRTKTGNTVSQFIYSNLITLSCYSSSKHKECFIVIWWCTSFSSVHNLEHGLAILQRGLIHSIWIIQTPLSIPELEELPQAMLFPMPYICHVHWTVSNWFEQPQPAIAGACVIIRC